MSSVLAWLELDSARSGGAALKGVHVAEGRLVAPSLKSDELVGALFRGAASDGQPMEVALCGAEPSDADPVMVWYQVEVWNAKSATWENPCVATRDGPTPRALAVRGVWDKSGARHDVAGKFTLACENGAIAKCISWGYKPWARRARRLLEELHQACTRMARADYCGDGRSHTQDDTVIDIYDRLEIQTRTRAETADLVHGLFSFEAAWDSGGAVCLARMRDGQKLETILEECPGRFQVSDQDLGDGDRCTLNRKGGGANVSLLRNRSYGKGE